MEKLSASKLEKTPMDEKSNQSKTIKKKDDDDYSFDTDNITWFLNLQYHYSCFFRSIKAISICIILTLIAVKFTYNPLSKSIIATSFDDFWSQNNLYYVLSVSVSVIILYVAAGTFMHLALLYFKWDTVMSVMLNGSFLYVTAVVFGYLVVITCINYELNIDFITIAFIVWNFSILTFLSIRWKSSMILKKASLLITTALMSTMLINNLSITLLWMFIAVISFWDVFAVLNCYGPLNLMIQVLEDRNANIPAGMTFPLGSDEIDDDDEHFETAEEQLNKRGPELGLGDFLMFSLFLGIVSLEENWLLTFICYFSIMIGMFITDVAMMVHNYQTFPALPFPIFCAMSSYYVYKGFISLTSNVLLSRCFTEI